MKPVIKVWLGDAYAHARVTFGDSVREEMFMYPLWSIYLSSQKQAEYSLKSATKWANDVAEIMVKYTKG